MAGVCQGTEVQMHKLQHNTEEHTPYLLIYMTSLFLGKRAFYLTYKLDHQGTDKLYR